MLKGIDVSTFNTVTDWSKVGKQVDFVIIRAGYGRNNVDQKFIPHANACRQYGIPIGLYWFSYAYTVEMARNEALYCIEQAKKYDVKYPIAFDFEYDSVNYAATKGVTATASLITAMTIAFCKEIVDAGYTPAVYLNKDYANRYYNIAELKARGYQIWYAYYNKECDRNDVEMWQYSSSGAVEGITGNVDMNYYYKIIPEAEKTGWIQEKCGRWWYCHADGGYTQNAWEKIDGKWYHFDEKGWMQTGWLEEEKKKQWYYLKSDGSMASDEILVIPSKNGNETYYFHADGHMCRTNDRGALI